MYDVDHATRPHVAPRAALGRTFAHLQLCLRAFR
jgi:hypothetical protein